MTSPQSVQSSINIVSHSTGVVIPVYFPQQIDTLRGEQLLRDTVASYTHHVTDPAAICLSVDGADFGATALAADQGRQ